MTFFERFELQIMAVVASAAIVVLILDLFIWRP